MRVIGDDPEGARPGQAASTSREPKRAPVIKGESTARGFEDEIEIESVDWSVSVEQRGSDSADTAHPEFEKVTLEKHVDVSTCALLKYANAHKRTDKIAITYVDLVLDPHGVNRAVPVVEFMLHGCYIDHVGLNVGSSSKGVSLNETVAISYKKINITYHPVGGKRQERGKAMIFNGEAAGPDR
jgi:type VI secretion system Hcp family effector